jgi:hypothetical protein
MLHQTATDSFLVQSYLSTVLLFAGIYTLMYRVAPSHWSGVPEVGSHTNTHTHPHNTYPRTHTSMFTPPGQIRCCRLVDHQRLHQDGLLLHHSHDQHWRMFVLHGCLDGAVWRHHTKRCVLPVPPCVCPGLPNVAHSFSLMNQMLLGVVYTTSIFARGFQILNKAKKQKKKSLWTRFRTGLRLPR